MTEPYFVHFLMSKIIRMVFFSYLDVEDKALSFK